MAIEINHHLQHVGLTDKSDPAANNVRIVSHQLRRRRDGKGEDELAITDDDAHMERLLQEMRQRSSV